MKKTFFVLLLLTLTATSASADDTLLKLSGKLETFGASYFKKVKTKESLFGEVRLMPKAIWTPNQTLTFIIEGDFQADTEALARGHINHLTETEHRWQINFRQALVEYQTDNLRLRLGKQLFEWGVADMVSPSDNLNPRDWLDFIKARDKVGIPSINLRYGGDTFVEAVFVPWLTNSKLPSGNQRWATDLPVGVSFTPAENSHDYQPQIAVRLGTNTSGYDLGASFYHGYSYSPTYKLTPTSATSANLSPVYQKQNVYTATLAKSLGAFNLRSEVGYFDQQNADNFIQYVVGVDREWSGVISETDSFYALIQYANSIITRHVSTVPGTFDLRRVLDNAIMAKLRYSPDDTNRWAYGVECSFNLAGHDWYVQPSIQGRIGNNLEAKLAVDLMGGPKDSFFGGFKNDRVSILVTLHF